MSFGVLVVLEGVLRTGRSGEVPDPLGPLRSDLLYGPSTPPFPGKGCRDRGTALPGLYYLPFFRQVRNRVTDGL